MGVLRPKIKLVMKKIDAQKFLRESSISSQNADITHWFALDADDLLHDEFIEELQKYEEKPAIILNHGYVLFKNRGK